MKKYAVAGAGLSGAVIARELAKQEDVYVDLFEERDHVAGNCHTKIDPATGVMIHAYGPHIFHTKSERVWQYVNQFAEFTPYQNRVIANTVRGIFSLPLNLLTINQFFSSAFNPGEALEFVTEQCISLGREPRNFEEAALSRVGRDLYENFFYGYTKKQWGIEPKEIPASVFGRLPIRYNYDSRYFSDPFQAIPKLGYTNMVENILDHDRINVRLNTPFFRTDVQHYDHSFFSGPIDSFFDYQLGPLGYRGIKFEWLRGTGDLQGNAVINHCQLETPHTRVTEYNHFLDTPKDKSIASIEYPYTSEPGDTPFYPIRSEKDKQLLAQYVFEAELLSKVSFIGRLGTYRYLNMDQVIADSLNIAGSFLDRNGDLPIFPYDPISQQWSL